MNKKIRIGYFADGPWSHRAFEKLIKDETIEFAFIVPRSDTTDDTLLNYAKKYHIDYLHKVKINSKDFIEKAASYNCDLFVSMSFNQIFRKTIINLPPLKTINCHAGKLPFYRGRNILNWVLINDESEFGITVHYIDEGIDTGDIILQECHPITDQDDYKSLLDKAFVACSDILYRAIKKLQKGDFEVTVQSDIHPVGFYCGRRGEGDENLTWNQSSRDVFNFVRSICKPGPVARAMIKGKEMKINKVNLIKDAPTYKSTIGQIVGKSETGLIVKTLDSTVEITEYEYPDELKIGDRFL